MAEEWKTGDLRIEFLYVGKGDCCMITTPDGHHIMIDCGSVKRPPIDEYGGLNNVKKKIRGILNLDGSKKEILHSLILTHPDEDHYRLIKEVFDGNDKVKAEINQVYFSDHKVYGELNKDTPLASYTRSGTDEFLRQNCKADKLFCVALNNDSNPNQIYKWKLGQESSFVQVDKDQEANKQNGPVKIASNSSNAQDWSIHIISGNNGDHDKPDDPIPRNAASLVTLVRFGSKKILICGDANGVTEKFLMDKYKQSTPFTIENDIHLIQVPHHGADEDCSTEDFVTFLKPKKAIVSSHLKDKKHHHPRRSVLKRYEQYLDPVAQKEVFSWVNFEMNHRIERSRSDPDRPSKEFLQIKQPQKANHESVAVASGRTVLDEIQDQVSQWAISAGVKACEHLDKTVSSNGKNYYRCEEDTAKEIYQTATHSEPFIFKPENS